MRIRLFTPDADPYPDPDPNSQIKAQTLEKVLKKAHILYVLAFYLQSDADPDPVPDPSYHFDADPDLDFYFMRIRIRIQFTKMLRIHNTAYSYS
jgi:hypothetical protein